MSQSTVMVTDAGLGSSIAVIRSLAAAGYRVVAADAERWSPGFYSRHTTRHIRYARPDKNDVDGVARRLVQWAEREGVDLIIPVTDALILPLARLRDSATRAVSIALPSTQALETARNKASTLALAHTLQIPAPQTAMAATIEEATAAARRLGMPVVVKPFVSRLMRDDGSVETLTVSFANSEAELIRILRRTPTSVLLQRYYPGQGYGVELLMDHGQPLAAFEHRRLREMPVTGGASALRESVALHASMYDMAVRLLASLEWTGLAMVEFKDGDDGPLLMEVNGRIWGSLPLAVHAGMDFPAKLAALYLDAPADSSRDVDVRYRAGVRSRNLELDIMWIGAVLLGRRRYDFLPFPQRIEAVMAIKALLDGSAKFDVLSRDDVRPGAAEILRIARHVMGKFWHAA